jgi:acyl-CoA thioesterase YciA
MSAPPHQSPNGPPTEPPTIRVTAMPADANFYGDIFGGWLTGLMDLAASSVASRHSGGRAVTAAMDAVSFLHPVRPGDEVSVYARLIAVGHSSMKIDVEAWQRDRDGEATAKVTQATFTYVAVTAEGRPRPLERHAP